MVMNQKLLSLKKEKKIMIDIQEQKLEEFDLDLARAKNSEIVLFNDDFNTFDFVIESLMAICDHTPEQAEQCTIIVHYKGKCGVKTGSYEELKPACTSLLDRGLTAEIL